MSQQINAAMIFAAGFGTRMGELTRSTPKPMLPLAGRPMIDHAIDLVRNAGIVRVVANTHYLADQIEPHLVRRDVVAVRETPEILETGGGLKAALPHLGADPVVTLNPDAAWTGSNPISTLLNAWRPEMSALLENGSFFSEIPLGTVNCKSMSTVRVCTFTLTEFAHQMKLQLTNSYSAKAQAQHENVSNS